MKYLLIFILTALFMTAYGQPENRLQPDSIYQNRKVRKIYAYLNSAKDLSEIIEFNRDGRKVRSVRYSASYDKKTRGRKRIEGMSYFKYDSQMRLIQVVDSAISWGEVNHRYYYYDTNGTLISSKYYQREFKTPQYEDYYQYNPLKITTVEKRDSIIVYNKTKEYERDFYVNKFYGYYLKPKLKDGITVLQGDTLRYQYADQNDLQRFEDHETITNKFDVKGKLVSSDVKSVFLTDRTIAYHLTYTYYSNGLLKSIYGYVPEYFKYEFY